MKRLLIAACLLLAGHAHAHGVQHRIEEDRAVTVELFYEDGSELAFERYEITRAGEQTPFQSGSTDARGRLAFLPDRPGAWRVLVFSEDGHGTEISFTTDAQGEIERADRPLLERHWRLVAGVSLLFGIFGLISLFARRPSPK
jgi:nickel transport protein